MSKYSAKDKISKKLEDSIAQTNAPLTEKDDLTPDEIAKLTPEEFDFAEYDETAAERAGYSNYSYWQHHKGVLQKQGCRYQFGNNAGAGAVHFPAAPAS